VVTRVLFGLGNAAVVHAGHGPGTTIARERETNHFASEDLSKNTKTI